jgi:hypothetical protein
LAAELALQIETRELVVGQAVPLKLQVINGRSSGAPEIPAGAGLLARYQGQSQRHVIVNFESTRIVEYTYQLAATQEGSWSVGPVQLVVDGEKLSAGPVQIEVGAPPVDQGEAPVMATVTDETPVLGQVVVYRFQFQHDKPVVNARWARPEFPGMVEEVHAEATQREYQMVQDGRPYTVQTIEVPLVAAGTGVHVIPPASVTAQFRTERQRRSRSRSRSAVDDLFGGSPFGIRGNTETRTYSTSPVTLEIAGLPPEGQPPNFSGLVGEFKVRMKTPQNTIKLGESATLELTIAGNGTLAGYKLPAASKDAGFRVYDDAPEISTRVLDGRFHSRMTVRRAVVPEVAGPLVIPALAIQTFDPLQDAYVEIRTQPLRLMVLPGEEGAGEVASFADKGVDQREAVASLDEDILPVSTHGGVGDRTLLGSMPLLVALPVVPVVGWMLLSCWGLVQNRRIDPRTELKRRLRALPSSESERLSALEDIFREAAGLRLGIPAPSVDAEQVQSLGELAQGLYADLDRVRYGGGDAQDLEQRVRRFVEGK